MAPKKPVEQDELMIVNDSPGEECRIAILHNGHLEELFTERTSTATNVGNIYKGRVVNVEPAIQAAFIDYGEGINGFLHISDLHPKYFPGEERTERVGKKIPRRDRPPIQHALKRGQEILVQVLKEGIGTKGPTLTSYLSIAGRLLVLMPDMDRVGVSRKVEDEEQRREMREILDSLDLPDGFGFILRTAGYGKTKTELKRDAAYLMRLWKVMEKRIKSVGAPCELYTESDLLIRTVRDVLRPSIGAVIVDSESAFDRASMFLQVVAPRSTLKVLRYSREAPIFHAFDVERQIELIHSREVPLPSGGRLVIDQTEALVAIDVNSGRSRSARDSETNAYETNCEAADEICRQLRLRDLGGLIVNDLIDMRSMKHRKQIEERFQNLLKRDRAKATVLPISEFGIIEMTRQRMRPSIRKSHFMDCPHCGGHGEIKVPEYVAADAARHIGFLLQFDRVKRVEIACSPRVASVLLSGKRRELVRLEDAHSDKAKRIDVRVSEAIAVDRVDYYAYDDRNADIDVEQLPHLQAPSIDELEKQAAEELIRGDEESGETSQPGRRRRRSGPVDATAIALAGDFADGLEDFEEEEEVEAVGDDATESAVAELIHEGQEPAQRGRRRRKRGRGRRGEQNGTPPMIDNAKPQDQSASTTAPSPSPEGERLATGKRSRRRRGRRRGRGGAEILPANGQPGGAPFEPNQPMENTSDQSMRIHELAGELGVTSREVIDRCEPDPTIHHFANALASVSAEEAQTIRTMFNESAEGEGTSEAPSTVESKSDGGGERPFKKSRRRRGRRRGGDKGDQTQAGPTIAAGAAPASRAPIANETVESASSQTSGSSPTQSPTHIPQHGRKRRRRRGRGGGGGGNESSSQNPSFGSHGTPQPAPVISTSNPQAPSHTAVVIPVTSPAKKKRRGLYGAARVSVSPLARESATPDE